jgi:arylsulfatase A-like enzyme
MFHIGMIRLLLLAQLFLVIAHGADTKPNIVLLMADDQGWGETGYNGHPQLKTPHMDAMAASGLRFDRFYAAAPFCSPTRAAVMTGRHPNRSGVFGPNWSTRPEEVTVASILKAGGYSTGHFGKWHIGAVKKECPTSPLRMGFDESLAHDNFFELNPTFSRNGETPEPFQGESSEILVKEALKFIGKAKAQERPFFTVVWFGSPHDPYHALPEDQALYAHLKDDPLERRFAEIAMDRAIGNMRAGLKEMGLHENTLVWHKSDNGLTHEGLGKGAAQRAFNGGLREHKGTLYEGGIRVPSVIEWPAAITHGRRTNVLAVSSDILPTLLELTGLKHPVPDRVLDGRSLAPWITGTAKSELRGSAVGFWQFDSKGESKNPSWMPEELTLGTTPTVREKKIIPFRNYQHPTPATENFNGGAAWIDWPWKIIWPKKGGTAFELYHLEHDPLEKQNLAQAEPERVTALTTALHTWQASVERSLSGADYAPKSAQ